MEERRIPGGHGEGSRILEMNEKGLLQDTKKRSTVECRKKKKGASGKKAISGGKKKKKKKKKPKKEPLFSPDG